MDKILKQDSFLLKHRIKTITTVFPATTVAATTSMMTGLNPVETAMLGWDMYYKDIDKTITTYLNSEKSDPEHKPLQEAIEYKNKHMITKSIMEEINERGTGSSYTLFPFGPNPYVDIDDMYSKIKVLCNEDGKKYIYAYDTEPDHTMHELGNDVEEINKIVENINYKVEELSKSINDTIIFVIADHGHKNIENIMLENYPDIVECLKRNTSIEPRAVNFFIKKDKKQEFPMLFNKYFGNDFDLYTKEEIISSKLFGDSTENEVFRDILGDYLAIAKTNKALLYDGSEVLKSHHAGYTDDEIYVPLIIIDTDKI
jgi:predicted AlkP superfamily pyrophosphatase or phosphodiesterase